MSNLSDDLWVYIFSFLSPISWPNMKLVKKMNDLLARIASQQSSRVIKLATLVPTFTHFSADQNLICQYRAANAMTESNSNHVSTFLERKVRNNFILEQTGYVINYSKILMQQKAILPETHVDFDCIASVMDAGPYYFAEQELQFSWCIVCNKNCCPIENNSFMSDARVTKVRATLEEVSTKNKIKSKHALKLKLKQAPSGFISLIYRIRFLIQAIIYLLLYAAMTRTVILQVVFMILLITFNDIVKLYKFVKFVMYGPVILYPISLVIMVFSLPIGLVMLYLVVSSINYNTTATGFVNDLEQHPKVFCIAWIVFHVGEYLYPFAGIIFATAMHMYCHPISTILCWTAKYDKKILVVLPY